MTTKSIKCSLFSTSRGPLVNRKDLQALPLVGPIQNKPVLAPLPVQPTMNGKLLNKDTKNIKVQTKYMLQFLLQEPIYQKYFSTNPKLKKFPKSAVKFFSKSDPSNLP